MTGFLLRRVRERAWLAETTISALEMVSRCPDVDELLRFWAREIHRAYESYPFALFVAEGDRWLRIIPEDQNEELALVNETVLSRALMSSLPERIPSLTSRDRETVLVRYSARDGWRGVIAFGRPKGRLGPADVRLAEEIAVAIGRTTSALRKTETSREKAIASERSRWAVELHDGHLQSLSSLKIRADVCLSLEEQHQELCLALGSSEEPSRLRSELSRLHYLIGGTVREARQFLLELRPPPVSNDQFLPWLNDYALDFERESGIPVDVSIEGIVELSSGQVDETTRLLREALTNVRKHAKAKSVRIVLSASEHATSIAVSDDGVGFDVPSTLERMMDSSHNGLIGVRYRAESIGGEMRLRSEPGKGTTMLFRLPRVPNPKESSRGRRTTATPPAPEIHRPTVSNLSVRESIRETLAEVIDTYIEQKSEVE